MYRPTTGSKCTCKKGLERDNCPTCEGTGWVINFARIRAFNALKDTRFTSEELLDSFVRTVLKGAL